MDFLFSCGLSTSCILSSEWPPGASNPCHAVQFSMSMHVALVQGGKWINLSADTPITYHDIGMLLDWSMSLACCEDREGFSFIARLTTTVSITWRRFVFDRLCLLFTYPCPPEIFLSINLQDPYMLIPHSIYTFKLSTYLNKSSIKVFGLPLLSINCLSNEFNCLSLIPQIISE